MLFYFKPSTIMTKGIPWTISHWRWWTIQVSVKVYQFRWCFSLRCHLEKAAVDTRSKWNHTNISAISAQVNKGKLMHTFSSRYQFCTTHRRYDKVWLTSTLDSIMFCFAEFDLKIKKLWNDSCPINMKISQSKSAKNWLNFPTNLLDLRCKSAANWLIKRDAQ